MIITNAERIFLNPLIMWLVLFLTAATTPCPGFAQNQSNKPYRIGLTPVFLANKTSFIRDWQAYLEYQLNAPVKFIQRQTYQDVTDLLLTGELDAAWLCGYPFISHRNQLSLLAVPEYQNQPVYQSYMIVPSSDLETQGIEDLKGKIFAYSDPNSNSGYLYPQVNMINKGINPGHYFRKTFFSWSHQDVVRAVAEGVANAGSVDGYVWDSISKINPELTAHTRVVSKSEDFGFPPFVINKDLPSVRQKVLKQALLRMDDNTAGMHILNKLNLDRFSEQNISLYDGIANMVEVYKTSQ